MGCQTSQDGTKKYLFPTEGGGFVETVYIPQGERATLCVSSQQGCKMGCQFCMTGRQGFQRQLQAWEILGQILRLPEYEKLSNVVYMGMGEPLENLRAVLPSLKVLTAPWGLGWSPKRITLSTIGLLPALQIFLEESKVHLALSLHNPFPYERAALMPVERRHPLEKILKSLKGHDFAHQRRLSFEYILLEGMNDSPRHAAELVRLVGGMPCRVNLLPYHALPDSPLKASLRTLTFQGWLQKEGLNCRVRTSRGEDILAACGMLCTEKGALSHPFLKPSGYSGAPTSSGGDGSSS